MEGLISRVIFLLIVVGVGNPVGSLEPSDEFVIVDELTQSIGLTRDDGFVYPMGVFESEAYLGFPGNEFPPATKCGEIRGLEKNDQGLWRSNGLILRTADCSPGDNLGYFMFRTDTQILAGVPGIWFDGSRVLDESMTGIYVWERSEGFQGVGGVNSGWLPRGLLRPEGMSDVESIGLTADRTDDLLAVSGFQRKDIQIAGQTIALRPFMNVYIFERDDTAELGWSYLQTITGDTEGFGSWIEFAGSDELIVGFPYVTPSEQFGTVQRLEPPFNPASRLVTFERRQDGRFERNQELVFATNEIVGSFDIHDDRIAVDVQVFNDESLISVIDLFARDGDGQWTFQDRIEDVQSNQKGVQFGFAPRFNTHAEIFAGGTGSPEYRGDFTVLGTGASEEYEVTQRTPHPQLFSSLVSPAAMGTATLDETALDRQQDEFLVAASGSVSRGIQYVYHFKRNSTAIDFVVETSISGLWYNATRAGEGYLIDVIGPETAVVFWFTYNTQGEQLWLIGVADVVDGNRLVIADLLQTSGPRFGASYDASDLRRFPWGDLTITFTGCNDAVVVYEGSLDGFSPGLTTLKRLSSIDGLPCAISAASENHKGGVPFGELSGAYYSAERDGEGVQLQISTSSTSGAPVGVAYWFTYDQSGNQIWLLGSGGRIVGGSIDFDEVLVTAGGIFGEEFDPNDVVLTSWGSFSMNFTADCSSVDLAYESTDPQFGSGVQTLTKLYSLSGFGRCPF